MKKTIKSIAWLLGLSLMATLSLTACSDDNDSSDNSGKSGSDSTAVTTYDDLAYFQNAIIEIDSAGELVGRSYGEVLYDNEPEHIFIGVDNIAAAEHFFRLWIAPDVEISASPVANGLTCQLTDEQGKAQGTIYFTPGTGTSVAEVTASAGTALKYFNRITFLLNSAWPYNESIYNHYTEGDIITHSPNIKDLGMPVLEPNDRTLKFVCIRQSSKGVKPMFCAITNSSYDCHEDYSDHSIRISDYSPCEAKAKAISKLLQASWDFYVERFNAAGCGKLTDNIRCWFDKTHYNWIEFFDYIYYKSGLIYGAKSHEFKLPYLLKIDWLDDDAICTSLAGTAGSGAVQGHETYISLFDGLNSTKWCTYADWKSKSIKSDDKVWFVDFQANAPVYPTGYMMTTGKDCEKYHGRNPKAWKLYAKGDIDDDWVQIAEVANGNMADVNCKTYSYTIDHPDDYMYFRLEISSCVSGATMQLSEFNLVTVEHE